MKNDKKVYTAPSLEITTLETEDIMLVSGIFESVDMMGLIGMGKIEMDIQ